MKLEVQIFYVRFQVFLISCSVCVCVSACAFSSVAEQKTTVSILDDIGSMFDDLADQLDAMLE